MKRLLVFFSLKADADPGRYEQWARDVDIPTVSALPSVASFTVHKCAETLGGAESPHDYVEIIDINDVEAFYNDIATDKMKTVAAEFAGFTDNPVFVWTEPVE